MRCVTRTDRPTDGLAWQRPLPAGCPAEPLPGGACRRPACWRCGAAEPWQERGARRWHAPAARLGGVRPSLCRPRGGGRGALQAAGTAGRLRGGAGAAHSAQFPSAGGSESRGGPGGGRLPAAISSAGSGMEGPDWRAARALLRAREAGGAASHSSAPREQGCRRRDAAGALATPSADRGCEGAVGVIKTRGRSPPPA